MIQPNGPQEDPKGSPPPVTLNLSANPDALKRAGYFNR